MPNVRKTISDYTQIDKALCWIDKNATNALNAGKQPYIEIGVEDAKDEERTDKQRCKNEAMITDIAQQAVFKTPGLTVNMRSYDREEAKALLVCWFERDCIQNLEPLRHGSRIVVDPFTGEQITIRASTTKFLKKEESNFIEWLYATGCDGGVVWSEPALKEYEEWSKAKNGN